MKSFIVIGLGRFGSEVARSLCRQGCEVLAIDVDSDLVQQISEEVTQAVTGDARDKEVLRALDAKSFDCGVVCIGDSSLLACSKSDARLQRALETRGALCIGRIWMLLLF